MNDTQLIHRLEEITAELAQLRKEVPPILRASDVTYAAWQVEQELRSLVRVLYDNHN